MERAEDTLRDLFDPERGPPPLATAIAFAIILVVGAALRIPPALDASVYLWDDAVIHLEAVYLGDALDAVGRALDDRRAEAETGEDHFRFAESVERFRREARGIAPVFGRPAHDVVTLGTLGAIRSLAPAREISATAVASAVSGTLGLVLMFVVARRMYGPGAGLVAMALLALDGAHVLYSRQGFCEAHQVVCILGAIALLLWARQGLDEHDEDESMHRGVLGVGLVLGIGILFHIRFLVPAFVIVVSEAIYTWRSREGRRHVPARVLLLAVGIGLPLLAAEIPYYSLVLAAKSKGILITAKTYVEQAVGVLAPQSLGYAASLVHFHVSNLFTYPIAYIVLVGFAPMIVGVGAMVDAVRSRRPPSRSTITLTRPYITDGELTVVALVVVPLVVYTFTVPLLRFGLLSFALVPLLCARAIVTFGHRGSREGALAAAVIAAGLVALVAVWRLLPIQPDLRTGYAEAVHQLELLGSADMELVAPAPETEAPLEGEPEPPREPEPIEETGIPGHVATMLPVFQALAGPDRAAAVPRTAEELDALVQEGKRYLVVDALVDFLSYEGRGFPDRQELVRTVERRCEPLARIENPHAATFLHALELNHQPLSATWRLVRESEARDAGFIRIYDLGTCRSWIDREDSTTELLPG